MTDCHRTKEQHKEKKLIDHDIKTTNVGVNRHIKTQKFLNLKPILTNKLTQILFSGQ